MTRTRHFLLQVALLSSFTFVYALTGFYGRREVAEAVANARAALRLERTLGIAWEHGVQNWALRGPHLLQDVANYTYFNCQFAVSILFLLWAYWRRNAHFGRIRDALLAANYVSVVVLFLYPMAPPRLVPGSGYVDTLSSNAVSLQSGFVAALNNPYSAMPSLHVSYAIVIGIAGFALTRPWWARLFWALYPGLVVYSIVATGNHFVLDVLGGAAALLATPLVSWASSRIEAAVRERRRSGPRSPRQGSLVES